MNSTYGSTLYDLSQWRLDWRQIAHNIRETGMSFRQQAETLGLEWSTYQRYLEGSEPKYSQGNALLTLHANMCGKNALNSVLKRTA